MTLGGFLLTNIFNMYYRVIIKDKSVKILLCSYFTEVWAAVFHFFTQWRFFKCTNKKVYWFAHWFLMLSYITMFVFIIFYLTWFQTYEIHAWYNPQRLVGYIITAGFLFGTLCFMIERYRRKEEIQKLPEVAIAKNYKYMCSDPGQELIINDIKEHNLNRVVVAACSPRIHELTFRKALQNAGLNPYMFEMANIREQDSWVHIDREQATKKVISLVLGAVNRVKWHEPLEKRTVEINPSTLVIGGGIAGMSSSLELANADQKVYLVEKSGSLDG